MAPISTCPNEAEILPVAAGDPAEGPLREHLDGCPGCRERVERLRAELAALREDVENHTPSPSTEPDPAVDHDDEPSSVGTTQDWPPSAPAVAGATTEPASGPEPATEAPDRAEGRVERPGAIGKYPVVDQLDEGGQGRVYRVIHPRLSRDMVLKLGRYPSAPTSGPRWSRRGGCWPTWNTSTSSGSTTWTSTTTGCSW
jgi:hypothetical protein